MDYLLVRVPPASQAIKNFRSSFSPNFSELIQVIFFKLHLSFIEVISYYNFQNFSASRNSNSHLVLSGQGTTPFRLQR